MLAEETKSTHRVEVVPVVLEKHPYADLLSIIRVFGYTVVGKTADWEGVTKAAYLPPDSLAPIDRKEFAWLKDTTNTFYNANCIKLSPGDIESYVRITVRRFRKILSYGLLVPVPDNVQIGDNVADLLGVIHYNPPEPMTTRGEATSGPSGINTLKYDVDSFQWHAQNVFVPGEIVLLTEKLHGASGKWVFTDGNFHSGSRTEWKRERPIGGGQQNLWWKALRNTPKLMEWLEKHPGYVVYGEVYGQVMNLKYGTNPGECRIGVFDIMKNGEWIDPEVAREMSLEIPWVPTVAKMEYDFQKVMDMAEGPSLIPGAQHFREGVVVKPLKERVHDEIGRVQLKVVSPSYLEKC